MVSSRVVVVLGVVPAFVQALAVAEFPVGVLI